MDFYLSMSGVLENELEQAKDAPRAEAPASYRVSGPEAAERFAKAHASAMEEAEKFLANYLAKAKEAEKEKPKKRGLPDKPKQ